LIGKIESFNKYFLRRLSSKFNAEQFNHSSFSAKDTFLRALNDFVEIIFRDYECAERE